MPHRRTSCVATRLLASTLVLASLFPTRDSIAQQPVKPPRDSATRPMPGMQMPATPAAKPPRHPPSDSSHMRHARADTAAKAAMPPGHMPGMTMTDSLGGSRALRSDTSSLGMRAGEMRGMRMFTPDPLGVSMDRMGSGTTWVPDAAPIPSRYAAAGRWDLTMHGFVFAQYANEGGPRGDRQLGSLNWGMLMASHTLAGGRFQARTMLSLDALGVTARGYPMLLQTGEIYNGRPLHDRQHPHDLFMELGALYERPVSSRLGVSLYVAPSGEPALGPVAFMHRPSAMDNPQAPIGHHWQDATHISFGVVSAGIFSHTFKLEASAFNGREPDQHRFDFEHGPLDSYSGRVTYDPNSHWSLEAGYGAIKSAELMAPNETMHRVTASILHGAQLGADGQWASTLLYGANAADHVVSHSALFESEAVLDQRNTVFGRAEFVQKSAGDLVLAPAEFSGPSDARFDVGRLSLGYLRELARFGGATLGAGLMGTVDLVPPALEPAYGSRTPRGGMIFLRLRPTGMRMNMSGPGSMPGMQHAPDAE